MFAFLRSLFESIFFQEDHWRNENQRRKDAAQRAGLVGRAQLFLEGFTKDIPSQYKLVRSLSEDESIKVYNIFFSHLENSNIKVIPEFFEYGYDYDYVVKIYKVESNDTLKNYVNEEKIKIRKIIDLETILSQVKNKLEVK